MIKYLWELDIEKIPLGWQQTYEDALAHSPDGEIVAMPDIDFHKDEINVIRYHYNPVKYRKKIIELFNLESKRARDLLCSAKPMKELFNELLKIDIKLFNLLVNWVSNDGTFDGSTFDPKYLDEQFVNAHDYFNVDREDIYPKALADYIDLRLIDLDA